MNSFEKMLQHDINKILFNSKELAEFHTLDGLEIPIIRDSRRLEKLKANNPYAENISSASLLIIVRAADLEAKPAEGGFLKLDDSKYRVIGVTESGIGEAILYEIVLGRNV